MIPLSPLPIASLTSPRRTNRWFTSQNSACHNNLRTDSLTDETIRKNWELYGHPDGRQEVSMGLALPSWIIESKNNIWVLGIYGIVFGGALPALVVRFPKI